MWNRVTFALVFISIRPPFDHHIFQKFISSQLLGCFSCWWAGWIADFEYFLLQVTWRAVSITIFFYYYYWTFFFSRFFFFGNHLFQVFQLSSSTYSFFNLKLWMERAWFLLSIRALSELSWMIFLSKIIFENWWSLGGRKMVDRGRFQLEI